MNLPAAHVLGHKPGLFLLFFTEMWERFSYYGMRALLVLFLIGEIAGDGWGWSRPAALNLYGLYTGLVYVTPILGGLLADKFLGYRNAVVLGALLMTLGHASLAFESAAAFYTGLALLILGNGFFKPNISTIVGQLYEGEPAKKDGAYTIFYMGINAGAFLGILLCGYVGEKVHWSYGFGLAGIFMFLGMVMFYFGQPIFGELGKRNDKKINVEKIAVEEDITPAHIIQDRLVVIGVLSFFTIFFWVAFEQAGGSMTIFAKDYTGRLLSGSAATLFFWANTALTVVPLAIVTYVLLRLVFVTYKDIPLSNASILVSFMIIWGIALWMLNKEFHMRAYDVTFNAQAENKTTKELETKTFNRTLQSDLPLSAGDELFLIDIDGKDGEGSLKILDAAVAPKFKKKFTASVIKQRANETEVPASWFGILNSFFIIAFAPFFSRLWESKWNPSAPVKFAVGLILLGTGFGVLAIGSSSVGITEKTAALSLWWLIAAYLFHTLGELCVSPVGLAYVNKLAPVKLVGLMFGVWFLASAIANYLAGFSGSFIDQISERYGLKTFFLIYTIIPIVAGLIMWLLNGWMKRRMHGVT